MVIDIELTENCSLQCPGCFLEGRSKREMPLTLLRRIINKYKPSKVVLRGKCGDPTYHTKIIEIVKFIKLKDILIQMDTNGQLPVVVKIDKYMNKLDVINFSIDGFYQETYKKYRINGNLQRALKHLTLMKNCTAVYKTILFDYITREEKKDILTFCKENNISTLFEKPWKKINKTFKNVNKFKCRSGSDELPIVFDLNGYIYPCCNLLPNKFKNNDYTPKYTINSKLVKSITKFDKTNCDSCKLACGIHNKIQKKVKQYL